MKQAPCPRRGVRSAAPVVRAIGSLAAGMCLCIAGPAHAQSERQIGDALRVVLPAATLGVELVRGDREGAGQFALAFTASVAATEVLKRTTHVERPDHSNDQSFPSGHATNAFAAATYVHRRHGFKYAWPLYMAATYVGYTRVNAQRHRWGDVIGSAAVSGAMTWWLVEPKRAPAVAVMPTLDRHYVGVQFHASW